MRLGILQVGDTLQTGKFDGFVFIGMRDAEIPNNEFNVGHPGNQFIHLRIG